MLEVYVTQNIRAASPVAEFECRSWQGRPDLLSWPALRLCTVLHHLRNL